MTPAVKSQPELAQAAHLGVVQYLLSAEPRTQVFCWNSGDLCSVQSEVESHQFESEMLKLKENLSSFGVTEESLYWNETTIFKVRQKLGWTLELIALYVVSLIHEIIPVTVTYFLLKLIFALCWTVKLHKSNESQVN